MANGGVIYTYSYQTPTDDGTGTGTMVNVPGSFSLSGIALDVAKGILFGLGKVSTITNVTATRSRPTVDNVTQTST